MRKEDEIETDLTESQRGYTDLVAEKEAKMIEEFIDFLKTRKKEVKRAREEIAFCCWPLKVKGKLTRQEIYDY